MSVGSLGEGVQAGVCLESPVRGCRAEETAKRVEDEEEEEQRDI